MRLHKICVAAIASMAVLLFAGSANARGHGHGGGRGGGFHSMNDFHGGGVRGAGFRGSVAGEVVVSTLTGVGLATAGTITVGTAIMDMAVSESFWAAGPIGVTRTIIRRTIHSAIILTGTMLTMAARMRRRMHRNITTFITTTALIRTRLRRTT